MCPEGNGLLQALPEQREEGGGCLVHHAALSPGVEGMERPEAAGPLQFVPLCSEPGCERTDWTREGLPGASGSPVTQQASWWPV